MEAERRRQMLLGVLLVALAAVLAARFWTRPSAAPGPTSNRRAAAATGAPAIAAAPDVRLDALQAERPKPVSAERNLFRFQPKAPPPPPPSVRQPGPNVGGPGGTAAPGTPPGPPPPIALKFIGLVEAPDSAQRIAVLSDGKNVFHGREGDIIEGRYRILRIGVESIELAYLDGRGRQSIRLTGS